MQICTGTGPIRIGGKQKPKPAPAFERPASYRTRVASLPISTPKISPALPRNGNVRPQTPNVEPRPASHSSGCVVGCAVRRAGLRGEVAEQVRRGAAARRDAVTGILRERLVLSGPVAEDGERAAAVAAAERDQQVALGRDAVDELDELQNRSQHREVVAR